MIYNKLLNSMYITKLSFLRLTVIFFSIAFFVSCNNKEDEIPFPTKDLGISQPTTIPLKFTEEKTIKWDTAKRGGIQPVTKNWILIPCHRFLMMLPGLNLLPNPRRKCILIIITWSLFHSTWKKYHQSPWI